jgi:hypothetical protein
MATKTPCDPNTPIRTSLTLSPHLLVNYFSPEDIPLPVVLFNM